MQYKRKCNPLIMCPVGFHEPDISIGSWFSAKDLAATWPPTAWSVCHNMCPACHSLISYPEFVQVNRLCMLYEVHIDEKMLIVMRLWIFRFSAESPVTSFLFSAVIMYLFNRFYFVPFFLVSVYYNTCNLFVPDMWTTEVLAINYRVINCFDNISNKRPTLSRSNLFRVN